MDNQLQTINTYNQYVKEYTEKFTNFGLYDDTFDFLLTQLPLQSKVLELGCGPGNVISYFLDKRKDLGILGVDLAPEMIRQARKTNPGAEFMVLDIRTAAEIQGKFQAVVGAFCLPYLSYEDLDQFFANLKNLTTDDGTIYLSCMEGPKEKSGFEKTSFTGDSEIYIYYHQRENLESKLALNGFAVSKFYTKDYPESDGTVTTDLIYIAKRIK